MSSVVLELEGLKDISSGKNLRLNTQCSVLLSPSYASPTPFSSSSRYIDSMVSSKIWTFFNHDVLFRMRISSDVALGSDKAVLVEEIGKKLAETEVEVPSKPS